MLSISGLLGNAAGLIGNLVSGIAGGVRNVGSPLVSGIATIVDATVVGIADLAGIVVGNLSNGVSGFVSTIGNWAGGILNTVVDFVNNAAHDIVGVFDPEIADALIPRVENDFQDNWPGIGSISGPIVENVGGAFEGVGSNIFRSSEPILESSSAMAMSAPASGGGIGPLSAASAAAPAGVSMLSAAAPTAARASTLAAPAAAAVAVQSEATEEVAAQDADPSPQILIGTVDEAAADSRVPDVTLPYLPGPSVGDFDLELPTPVVEGPIFLSEPTGPVLPEMGFDDIIGPSVGSNGQEIVFDNSFASGPDLYEAASLIAPVA